MKEGDELEVLVTGRDARGNVKLSRKALLNGSGSDRRSSGDGNGTSGSRSSHQRSRSV